jgi:hypothetical protein
MFICCPVSWELMDAQWHQNEENAMKDARLWSIMCDENVNVYRADEIEPGAYQFIKLHSFQ